MARLQEELLSRIEAVCDRVVHVADAAAKSGVSKRVTDQLIAAGTSIGANAFEADEAMSRADFVKCLCIACKELNETRFWLRLFGRHGWVSAKRLTPLLDEVVEVKKVLGAIIARTKSNARSKPV
jgi:four helix bundle protein